MHLIGSNLEAQFHLYIENENIIMVFFNWNLALVYFKNNSVLTDFKAYRMNNGTLEPTFKKSIVKIHKMIRENKIRLLHTVYPYHQESPFIIRSLNSEPVLSTTLQQVIEVNGKLQFQRVCKGNLQYRVHYNPEPELPFPLKRRLYCPDTKLHTYHWPTTPLHRCYIHHCPCRNIAFIGHCEKCGRIIHECIYPGCLWTMTNETVFHKNIVQYRKYVKAVSYLRQHFLTHAGEKVVLRDDVIKHYTPSSTDILEQLLFTHKELGTHVNDIRDQVS
jgi:hypothetical protein